MERELHGSYVQKKAKTKLCCAHGIIATLEYEELLNSYVVIRYQHDIKCPCPKRGQNSSLFKNHVQERILADDVCEKNIFINLKYFTHLSSFVKKGPMQFTSLKTQR